MSRSWLIQSKAFDRSVNIAPQTSFLSRANSIFSAMERNAFWVLKPSLTKSALISRKFIFKKMIATRYQTLNWSLQMSVLFGVYENKVVTYTYCHYFSTWNIARLTLDIRTSWYLFFKCLCFVVYHNTMDLVFIVSKG